MQPLKIEDYKPPFITETDEARWDDCTVCSTLMSVAAATLGEVVSAPDWSPLTKAGLKVRREKIRNWLPADKQTGPTTMADMRYAFSKEFPWLPKIPFYDEQDQTWKEVLEKLLDGWVGVLQGNPMNVKNVNSKLRRWTNNDDFGHAIHADRARKKADGTFDVFIMDPLGRGAYEGEWVPATEVKEFIDEFGPNNTLVKANMFKRGAWSDYVDNSAALKAKIAELKAQVFSAESIAAANKVRAEVAEAKVLKVKDAVTDVAVAVDNASELAGVLEQVVA